MAGPLRKRLTYRDQGSTSLEAHTAHWQGFTWQAGSTIVASKGPWGTVQVWASSEGEGKRVIRHAAAIAGFDPDGDPEAEWIVTTCTDPRFGKSGTMALRNLKWGQAVTKRDGPFGQPEVIDGTWG